MDSRLTRLRKRCREDLIFLAQHVLGYDKITEETHGSVAKIFIQKREGIKTLDQSEIKERLFMMPRGTFKSTLDVCDIVQTILVDPDVRILVLTGAGNLAGAFIGEIAGHFVIKHGNLLNLIFPEYCFKDSEVKSDEFTVPCRTKTYKEPTVMGVGIESGTSGFHYDEIRGDDIVTNRNSISPTYLERTTANLHMARKLLNPGGYLYLIGTHYNPSDAYSLAIDHACEEAEVKRKDIEDRLIDESEPVLVGDLLILRKPAWIHKYRKSILTSDELRSASDFKILFPSILSFKFLAKEYRKDPQSFFTQYLNDPYVAAGAIITPELLRSCTCPADQIPADGQTFSVWDLSYKNGRVNDYTAGIVGKLHNGVMYVTDSVYTKYRPSEIGRGIAANVLKWQAGQVDIEDCLGAQWLESTIRNALFEFPCNITWLPIDRSINSKQVRIKSVETVLSSGKLYFSSNMSNLSIMYDQLLKAGVAKHDDLADVLAYLCNRIPVDRKAESVQNIDLAAEARKKALYRLVYGGMDSAPIMPKEPELYTPDREGSQDLICPGLGF